MSLSFFLRKLEVLAARKTYFHGTSAKFLRSILKNGILPQTKEGVWKKETEHNSPASPSKKSFGGSYWALDAGTALRYANDAERKLGGNPLVVAAELETRSALPDEDDFLSVIERGVNRLWGKDYSTSGENAVMFNYLSLLFKHQTSSDMIKNWRAIFLEDLSDVMKGAKFQTPDFLKLLDDLLLAELTRRVSYFDRKEGGMYGYQYYLKQALERLELSRDTEVNQPTPAEGENARREALDHLMRKLKKVAQRESSIGSTLRMLQPVKFSGANKITMVLELIETKEEDKTTYKFKLHYGSLSPKFVEGWKTRMGYDFTLV